MNAQEISKQGAENCKQPAWLVNTIDSAAFHKYKQIQSGDGLRQGHVTLAWRLCEDTRK